MRIRVFRGVFIEFGRLHGWLSWGYIPGLGILIGICFNLIKGCSLGWDIFLSVRV